MTSRRWYEPEAPAAALPARTWRDTAEDLACAATVAVVIVCVYVALGTSIDWGAVPR